MDLIKNHEFGEKITSLRMHKEKLKFCLSLYTNFHNRKTVQDAIEKFEFFLSKLYLPFIMQQIETILQDGNVLKTIQTIFKENEKPFANFSTETKRFNVKTFQCIPNRKHIHRSNRLCNR